ncbi:MAG: phospholipid-binding protein MlaC [Pasteurellaceae bacterium]|nr:phospholipid-binding protein MlaC [Pasteurellaceae bacterium]
MKLMKTWFGKTLAFLTAVFAVQTAVAAVPAYELTQQVSNKLFADIKASQSQINANPNYLRTIVRQDLMPYVHVNYAGSLILGQYFKSSTPEQRDQFFMALDKYIEQVYAQALTLYKGQALKIEEPKDATDTFAKVRVKVDQGSAAPINLDFSWRKNSKTGSWQVYDMAAEGQSVVESKKQEWAGILRKDGIDALTARLQKDATNSVTISK